MPINSPPPRRSRKRLVTRTRRRDFTAKARLRTIKVGRLGLNGPIVYGVIRMDGSVQLIVPDTASVWSSR